MSRQFILLIVCTGLGFALLGAGYWIAGLLVPATVAGTELIDRNKKHSQESKELDKEHSANLLALPKKSNSELKRDLIDV